MATISQEEARKVEDVELAVSLLVTDAELASDVAAADDLLVPNPRQPGRLTEKAAAATITFATAAGIVGTAIEAVPAAAATTVTASSHASHQGRNHHRGNHHPRMRKEIRDETLAPGESDWTEAAAHPIPHVSTATEDHRIQRLNHQTDAEAASEPIDATIKVPEMVPVHHHGAVHEVDYVVQPGENSTEVASEHHESLPKFEDENPEVAAHPDLIFAGQHVKVEEKDQPEKAVVVTAEEGTTYWAALKQHGIKPTAENCAEMAAYNHTKAGDIQIGQKLRIPPSLLRQRSTAHHTDPVHRHGHPDQPGHHGSKAGHHKPTARRHVVKPKPVVPPSPEQQRETRAVVAQSSAHLKKLAEKVRAAGAAPKAETPAVPAPVADPVKQAVDMYLKQTTHANPIYTPEAEGLKDLADAGLQNPKTLSNVADQLPESGDVGDAFTKQATTGLNSLLAGQSETMPTDQIHALGHLIGVMTEDAQSPAAHAVSVARIANGLTPTPEAGQSQQPDPNPGEHHAAGGHGENHDGRHEGSVNNPQVTLRQILAGDAIEESGAPARPSVTNPYGYHGAWQFSPEYWPSWAAEALGDKDAPMDTDNQVMVAAYLWTHNLKNLGSVDAAAAEWLKGGTVAKGIASENPDEFKNAESQADGNNTTVEDYMAIIEHNVKTVNAKTELPFLEGVISRHPGFDWSVLDQKFPLYAKLREKQIDPPSEHHVTHAKPPHTHVHTAACAAGTNDIGAHTIYVDGKPQQAELCTIPGFHSSSEESTPGNQYYVPHADGLVIVNADISKEELGLFDEAKAHGITLDAMSSYRTYRHQEDLWNASGHNQAVVAPPGYSNHGEAEAIDYDLGPSSPLVASYYGTEHGGDPSPENPRIDSKSYIYEFLVKYAGQFGLHQYYREPWHFSPDGR